MVLGLVLESSSLSLSLSLCSLGLRGSEVNDS
jgi:hypothetical protein